MTATTNKNTINIDQTVEKGIYENYISRLGKNIRVTYVGVWGGR